MCNSIGESFQNFHAQIGIYLTSSTTRTGTTSDCSISEDATNEHVYISDTQQIISILGAQEFISCEGDANGHNFHPDQDSVLSLITSDRPMSEDDYEPTLDVNSQLSHATSEQKSELTIILEGDTYDSEVHRLDEETPLLA